MKKILFLLLVSLSAFGQRMGLIDADTTTRPKAGLSALAFSAGQLKIIRNTGNSYGVITSNNTYVNPSWLASIALAKVTGLDTSIFLRKTTAASLYQPKGNYLTSITSSQVTTALGYTPYNATNPSGYITSAALGVKADTASIVVKSKTIATTTGQSWSTTNTVAQINDAIVSKKSTYSKKLIGIGSSMLYGWFGNLDSNPNGGWFGQLSAELVNDGWTVKNYGIPGNSIADVYSRFGTDILPENPDVVVIGISPWNNGFGNTGVEIDKWNEFKSGIQKLISLCRQHNIIPVVATGYGNNNWTTAQYNYIKAYNRQLESEGVEIIDVHSIIYDETTGNILSGFAADALHANQAGHTAIFRGINPKNFNFLRREKMEISSGEENCAYVANEQTVATQTPFTFTPKYPLYSFSISFWVKQNYVVAASKAFLGIGSGTGNRIRNPTNVLQYTTFDNSQSIVSSTNMLDMKWHHVVLTYNHASAIVSLYIDNVLVGSITQTLTCDLITFLCRSDGASPATVGMYIKDIAIYRVPLYHEDITGLYFGKIKRAGLEVFSPLNDPNFKPGTPVANLAGNAENITVGTTALETLTAKKPSATDIPFITALVRDALVGRSTNDKVFCLDCIATDGSVGVQQIWNGVAWKNNW